MQEYYSARDIDRSETGEGQDTHANDLSTTSGQRSDDYCSVDQTWIDSRAVYNREPLVYEYAPEAHARDTYHRNI
jgi:hypothetical protein